MSRYSEPLLYVHSPRTKPDKHLASTKEPLNPKRRISDRRFLTWFKGHMTKAVRVYDALALRHKKLLLAKRLRLMTEELL